MKKQKCQKCKEYSEFTYINSVSTSGKKHYMCRDCNTKRVKKYRSTPEGKKKVYTAVYKSIDKHMDKHLARVKLNYHVKIGNIKKPLDCTKCRLNKKLEGHHVDYTKPLEVIWLCRTCHAFVDKCMRKEYN